jgi:hypothetical protein
MKDSHDIEYWLNHNNFYVMHGTTTFESLINILEAGRLNRGADIDKKFTELGKCGGTSEGIYTNIYFDDIKNIGEVGIFPFILLFHPRVLFRSKAEFWLSWGYCGMKPLKMDPYDDTKIMKSNIKKIKKIVKQLKENATSLLPSFCEGTPGNWLHEIYLDTKYIPLTDNLLGIMCNGVNEKSIEKIKQTISVHPYKNIYIQNNLFSLPDFKDINK